LDYYANGHWDAGWGDREIDDMHASIGIKQNKKRPLMPLEKQFMLKYNDVY